MFDEIKGFKRIRNEVVLWLMLFTFSMVACLILFTIYCIKNATIIAGLSGMGFGISIVAFIVELIKFKSILVSIGVEEHKIIEKLEYYEKQEKRRKSNGRK